MLTSKPYILTFPKNGIEVRMSRASAQVLIDHYGVLSADVDSVMLDASREHGAGVVKLVAAEPSTRPAFGLIDTPHPIAIIAD